LFRNAPIAILVYCGNYDITGLDVLMDIGVSKEEIFTLYKPSPGIQGMSAALENLMLAAANLGYGTCWMTSQNYAAKEISEYIGFKKEGYFLATITPLGVPAGEPKSPGRKPIEEVVTIIE
jgi:nitroreductase